METTKSVNDKEFLANVSDSSFVFPDSILKEIQGVPLAANLLQDDILIWGFSKDGSFNLQSAYLLSKGLNPLNLTTQKLWVWKAKPLQESNSSFGFASTPASLQRKCWVQGVLTWIILVICVELVWSLLSMFCVIAVWLGKFGGIWVLIILDKIFMAPH